MYFPYAASDDVLDRGLVTFSFLATLWFVWREQKTGGKETKNRWKGNEKQVERKWKTGGKETKNRWRGNEKQVERVEDKLQRAWSGTQAFSWRRLCAVPNSLRQIGKENMLPKRSEQNLTNICVGKNHFLENRNLHISVFNVNCKPKHVTVVYTLHQSSLSFPPRG